MPDADLSQLQAALGYTFKDEALLRLALTHRSHGAEAGAKDSSNERLEFLGDAVLGLAVADHLYRRYPDLAEGQMTVLRSALVRQDALAALAQRLSLGQYLLLGRGEERSGGPGRPRNLARAAEAIFGAVFLDRGLAAAQRLALRLLRGDLEEALSAGAPGDPKSRLQEVVQARGAAAPVYRLLEEAGPEHDRRFVMEVLVRGRPLARGQGHSKRQAEESAAELALQSLSQKQ